MLRRLHSLLSEWDDTVWYNQHHVTCTHYYNNKRNETRESLVSNDNFFALRLMYHSSLQLPIG